MAWEINLGNSWVRYDAETEELIAHAHANGLQFVEYEARRQPYVVDIAALRQINRRTGVAREIRRREVVEEAPQEEAVNNAPPRSERLTRLLERLLSPEVHVPVPVEIPEEPARLSQEQVRALFVKHVPGVERFLYRDMPGQFAFAFIPMAYAFGLRAFQGTAVHGHLLSLLRVTVHHAHDDKPGAAGYLREVAEAFMDCQAVQGRVVERVGLQILGVGDDFRGLVERLVGEYKVMAIKMLAAERIRQRKASDDGNPTHYENRLIADVGNAVGYNKDEIRLAMLDGHAAQRFPKLPREEVHRAAARCRELFDVEAMLQALCAEINAFNEDSPPQSLPRMFLDWANTRMEHSHLVFDEATCSHVEIVYPLALAIVEVLFFGRSEAPSGESYRGHEVQNLFK